MYLGKSKKIKTKKNTFYSLFFSFDFINDLLSFFKVCLINVGLDDDLRDFLLFEAFLLV
jgi:hypothetical protein